MSEIDENQHIVVIVGVSEVPPSSLPPPPWYEEYTPRTQRLPSVRQTVRRDSRLLTSSSLPSFSAPNCRSIFPKIRSIVKDMRLRSISCILASESWEKATSKKVQKEVERLFEMEDLQMISKPRKYRRGGGVCILADVSKVSIKPLEIPSGNLEIIWALIKLPVESVIKEIIVFSFYMAPKRRMKTKMTDHIVTTLHQLLTVYPGAEIMGAGDRNEWNVSPIIAAIPRLLNLQQLPTLNGKNLDIFLSNMGPFYSTPVICPPIRADSPSRGKDGDHKVPVIYPLDNGSLG